MDYTIRKNWTRQKNGLYKSSDRRFEIRPVYNQIYGGDCWKVKDTVTDNAEYGRTFTECRESAAHMADMVCHMEACEYKTGMTAYPGDGSTVRIDEVGHGKKDEEFDCSFTWLTGKNRGGTGYIGDVRYLYIQKPYDTGNMDIL